jgi:hypothetical protein
VVYLLLCVEGCVAIGGVLLKFDISAEIFSEKFKLPIPFYNGLIRVQNTLLHSVTRQKLKYDRLMKQC